MALEKDPVKWRNICQQLMQSCRGGDMMPGRGIYLIARDLRDQYLSEIVKLEKADSFTEQKQTGVVIAVGPRRENLMGTEMDFVFNVGDKVLFNQMAGKPLNMHGLELVLLEESDIKMRMNRNGLGA